MFKMYQSRKGNKSSAIYKLSYHLYLGSLGELIERNLLSLLRMYSLTDKVIVYE